LLNEETVEEFLSLIVPPQNMVLLTSRRNQEDVITTFSTGWEVFKTILNRSQKIYCFLWQHVYSVIPFQEYVMLFSSPVMLL
jgi:hypothetical protein